ncbi:hypothetical protein [Neptuniibacter halophilus]|uniref:hypothetical protein n=1 Tax=Neptuniibacter halophilus TaxID=651666 RepID=UPI0025733CA6|nr:hypothetical protein [Neptuniibacter halophilus]
MKSVTLPALLLVPVLLAAPRVDAAPVKQIETQAVEQPASALVQEQPQDKKSRLYMALLMALKNR